MPGINCLGKWSTICLQLSLNTWFVNTANCLCFIFFIAMKFLLLRFALTSLVGFQVDEFILTVGSYLFTSMLFLGRKVR